MRLITKLWATLLLLCVAGVANAATEYEIDQKFTSVAELEGQLVCIVNETDAKAFFNKDNQNLAYDTYSTAMAGTAYLWKFHSLAGEADAEVQSCYSVEAVKANGSSIGLWGNPAIFLNSGAEGGFDGCFILGQGDKYGTDVKYGGVWEVEYDAEKGFALKNKARGGYFAGVNPAPTGSEPVYWTICTLKEKAPTDPLAEQKTGLEAAIAKGKMYNAIAYTEATFGTLTTAIADGETALVADGATAESLTTATTTITDAIAALAYKDGFIDLTANMFKTWDKCDVADVTSTGAAGCSYKTFVSADLPYGDASVGEFNYANLSNFEKLIVVATEGTPRFMFNRDVANGQWNATESESHLIEYPKEGWSSKYFTKEETVFTVELKQMVADKGFAHLNAIKGANWANVTVTGMYLFKTPTELMNEAKALAADLDAVAVGKLLAAIEAAEQSGDESNLQAAIDQFKANNADMEKDETAKVATDGWKKFETNTKADLAPDWAAPAVTTYDGRTAQPAEVYETTVATTGQIIYQNISGLTNGKYKVGFYGTAYYTNGRGFDSEMEDGSTDVAYVFANDKKAFITSRIGTAFSEYSLLQFDVQVTDGTIKLGMGKDKPGTNWHTMQIFQLTWFTTAKEAYAAVKADMTAAVAAAKTLAADANKTEGKEAFATAIADAEAALASNMLTVAELDAEVVKIKEATETFKKANYFIDFAEGAYYVIDAESGKFMAAGHDYGTRGIVNEIGLDLTVAINTEKRMVTFDSKVANNSTNHFLGTNLYMDAAAAEWALEYQGFGFYITNGTQYINIDDKDNLVMSDTPREWIIVTTEGVMSQRLEEMANATAENPVDATFLIQGANFNRNDQRNNAWTVSENCTNKNLSGGNQLNNCAESYHSLFTISQTLNNAPKGLYKMTAQGFYRQDEGMEEAAPVFFIGDKTTEIPVKTGTENSMSDASGSFTNGLYTIDSIDYEFFGDKLTVGVKNETAANQWIIFDNFRLTYFGTSPLIEAKASLNAAIIEAATDTIEKKGVDALETAIAAAKAALVDAEATVETIQAAEAALAEAVTAFKLANTEIALTLQGKVDEEVSLTFGVWDTEDTFYVDFGDGKVQTAKVGINNKGPVQEDGTTASATKFTGTVAGDGTIKVYGNNDIWYLVTYGAALPTTFDQPKLMNVVQMSITGADVESVELPAYPKMTQFSLNNSSVKSVDVTKVTSLTSLTINSTSASKFAPQLESIDLSNNTELTYLSLQGNQNNYGKLTSLDLSNNTKLQGMGLYVQYNQIAELTLPAEWAADEVTETQTITYGLTTINVQNNKLTTLNTANLKKLKQIYAADNLLTSIDLSGMENLAWLDVKNNKLSGELDLTVSEKLTNVYVNNNELTSVKVSNVTKQFYVDGNKLTLATIPAQPAGMNTASKGKQFHYAPQAALEVPATVTELDLSAQATVAQGELDPADFTTYLTGATTFSFVTASGATLVEGTDYEVTEPGKFKFTKYQAEKVHGVMLNEALPKFTAEAPFTTTEFFVSAPAEPIEGISYSWESPAGNPAEFGGTIAYVNGDGNRLNYAQANYFTICLNGKKANVNDETASANAGKMVITLDKAVAAGDTIAYTAFINKNETKKSSPYIIFENGTTAEGEIFGDEANIDATFNGVPTLKYTIVPAEAAGSKTITLTRSQTGTNLFITKLQVIEKKVDPALIAAKNALLAIIDGDKTIATEGMQGAEALTTAITDAETAANDDNATIESIAAARAALAKAVATFTKANLGEEFAEIAQNQGKDLDNFARAELVEGEDYNTYTVNADLTIAIKMMNLDVKNCDYLVVKFAEPVAAGWNLAFWSGQDLTGVAAGATEFKYVFADDPNCGIENGVLPQICMMTFIGGFQAPLEAKVVGIYKHFTDEYMTSINAVKTQRENGEFYNLNGQKMNKAQKGLYIINGKKVVVK